MHQNRLEKSLVLKGWCSKAANFSWVMMMDVLQQKFSVYFLFPPWAVTVLAAQINAGIM